MNVHDLVLFIHVLAGAVLLGSSISHPVLRAAIRGAPSVGALRPWLAFARESARANPAAALAALASGIYLGPGRWSEAWLLVSVALFLANTALAAGVVKANGARLGGLVQAASDGPIGPELEQARRSSRWDLAADALIANDLTLLFLMTNQPGLVGSIAAAVLANGGLVAYRALRRRHGSAPVPAPAA